MLKDPLPARLGATANEKPYEAQMSDRLSLFGDGYRWELLMKAHPIRPGSRALLLLSAALLLGSLALLEVGKGPLLPSTRVAVLAEWSRARRGSYEGLHAYLGRLAHEQRFLDLEWIASAEDPESESAASLLVRNLSSSEAVRLCERLEGGKLYSFCWRAAFVELSQHDREVVVPYLLRVVRTGGSTARCHCYEVCGGARWPDLLDYAALDQDSDEPFLDGYQADRIEIRTLGTCAREYLEQFSQGMRAVRSHGGASVDPLLQGK